MVFRARDTSYHDDTQCVSRSASPLGFGQRQHWHWHRLVQFHVELVPLRYAVFLTSRQLSKVLHSSYVDVVVENKPLTKSEKKKVFAIILISTFSVIFWVFWYLTYLAAYDYGAAFINMNVSGFNVPL